METKRLKRLPVGIQTFEKIRENDMLYIDKTEYIWNMIHLSKYIFLSRPRRFGKSLLVSTLQAYFEGRKDLFKGLFIETVEKEWTEYPVLRFSLSTAKHCNKEELLLELSNKLTHYEAIYGKGAADEVKPNQRLKGIIERAYKKTGKKVVVLIDEYDAPLLDVVHEEEMLPVLRNVMRNFYSPLKDCDPYLKFVFITGITKFSQLSIFSELNNINNVSMDIPYAGICGITQEELLTQMSDDIDRLAEKLELTREETISQLKRHYDGYHFCWPSPDVFNPYSLLNCFSKQEINSYWFGSGTPTYLINMMRKFDVMPSTIHKMMAKASAFDAPTENMKTITPLLYQSGYVTIKDYDKMSQIYTLDIPNNEILVGLYESLLPNYLNNLTDQGNVAIAQMSVMIRKGDIDGGLQLIKDFLETVPYCDNTNYEGHYQQMFHIIFALLTDYQINVEQRIAKGRIDSVLETSTHIYIIEMKFNKSAHEALAQINDKQYAIAFEKKGKTIVKVGLNFKISRGCNTLEWAIE